jgi:hypothetical protein
MTPEQKAVVLDAAQEMQHNEEWWEEFEFKEVMSGWKLCTPTENPIDRFSQGWIFRRRPKTITVTMPVPIQVLVGSNGDLVISFNDSLSNADSVTALAAIREAMKDE